MGKFLKPRFKLYRKKKFNFYLKNRFVDCKLPEKEEDNFNEINLEVLPTHFFYQLKEKQKLKFIYGVMEKQFKSYYIKSKKIGGNLSENMIRLLESRLDNILYRMGIGLTRSDSRQIVNHNFLLVNNISVNIPSYIIKLGDIVSVKEKYFYNYRIVNSFNIYNKNNLCPSWLFINFKNFSCYLKRYPDISELDYIIDENLVSSFYSR